MSGEYGCTSDPDNMLDAEIVKLDGSVVWASQEPELLWGLRGAQLGLGGKYSGYSPVMLFVAKAIRSGHKFQIASTQVSTRDLGRRHYGTQKQRNGVCLWSCCHG